MNRTLTVLLLLPLTGCELGRDCTLEFSPASLAVTVEAAEWEPGAWVVELDDRACTVTLPSSDDPICDDGLSVELTDDGSGIVGLFLFNDAPDTAEIAFEHDGDEIFRETVIPVYDETEENGEGCGTARHGDVTVTLP